MEESQAARDKRQRGRGKGEKCSRTERKDSKLCINLQSCSSRKGLEKVKRRRVSEKQKESVIKTKGRESSKDKVGA